MTRAASRPKVGIMLRLPEPLRAEIERTAKRRGVSMNTEMVERLSPVRNAGRPTTAPRDGDKATLGVRVSPPLKRKIMESAEASFRSLSAEAEFRLEQSYYRDDLVQRLLRAARGEG